MNEALDNIIERRSCKSYKPDHVDKETLDLIIKAGLNAPSGMNLQTPRFVVVQNAEVVNMLSKMNAKVMGVDADPFYGAPDVIVVLVKKECTYVCDGALAMGNLMNAAYSLGVASRWINRAKEVFETKEGKELLKNWGIDEDVQGIGFCILGYASEGYDYPEKEIVPKRVVYVD